MGSPCRSGEKARFKSLKRPGEEAIPEFSVSAIVESSPQMDKTYQNDTWVEGRLATKETGAALETPPLDHK